MYLLRFFAFLCSLLVTVAASGPVVAGQAAISPMVALRDLDERVLTVGHRLAVGSVDLCRERGWQLGFSIHDISQYPRSARASAIAAFNLGDGPAVLAVARGGPAEAAGLRRDDVLLAADGAPLPRAPESAANTFAPTERMLDVLDAAFADGEAVLTIRRAGAPTTIRVAAAPGCPSRFQVIPSESINAKADGRYVQVTSAIAQLAANDDELAAMIGHELAHNILRHRARLAAAGVERGLLEGLGRNARLIRVTEMEADRLSPYLLDRAGFNPQGAVRWWQRIGPRTASIFPPATHPRWRDRVTAVQAEVAAIERARRVGQRAEPPAVTELPAP